MSTASHSKQVRSLIAEAAQHLRAIAAGGDDLTDDYRAVADILIDIRSLMTTPDGRPDWGGRSYTYRTAVGDAYDEAGIHGEDRSRIAANVRHHVSYMLHSRLTPEELEDAGIGPKSSRERQRNVQKQRRAIVQGVRNNKVDGADPVQAIVAAKRFIESLSEDDIRELTARRLDHFTEALTDAQVSLSKLFDEINAVKMDVLLRDGKVQHYHIPTRPEERAKRLQYETKPRRNTQNTESSSRRQSEEV